MPRAVASWGVLALGLACASLDATIADIKQPILPGTGAHQSHKPELSDDLQREVEYARAGPARDRALHAMTAASLAIAAGDAVLAGEMIDVAIAEIEALYTGTDNDAVDARKLYHREDEKPFKGEPYERMMAYVYRGLLDYGAGDYENAAASFRAAILQDAFADEGQHRCDFEVAEYLLARAMLMGGAEAHLIDDAYNEAASLAAEHRTHLPALDERHNVLVYVEVGRSPHKYPTGESREQLKLMGRERGGARAELLVDAGSPLLTRETGSLGFQATTRGGRHFDVILAGQAYRKGQLEDGGVAFNQVGTATGIPVLELVGLAMYVYGESVAPQADTRYWDRLPDSVHLVPLLLEPGPHELRVRFLDAAGELRRVQGKTVEQALRINAPSEGDVLVWVSEYDHWPERQIERYTPSP